VNLWGNLQTGCAHGVSSRGVGMCRHLSLSDTDGESMEYRTGRVCQIYTQLPVRQPWRMQRRVVCTHRLKYTLNSRFEQHGRDVSYEQTGCSPPPPGIAFIAVETLPVPHTLPVKTHTLYIWRALQGGGCGDVACAAHPPCKNTHSIYMACLTGRGLWRRCLCRTPSL
jgi:hypothetical protein